MIQRVQSIFLTLVAGILMLLVITNRSFYTAEGKVSKDKTSTNIEAKLQLKFVGAQRQVVGDGEIISPINLVGYATFSLALLSLIGLFSFKNRRFQATLCGFVILGHLILMILMWLETTKVDQWLTEVSKSGFELWALTPLLTATLTILAIRRIFADERLVKSMDRFR